MISYLKGVIKLKAENFVIIDVSGVGYKVFASEETLLKVGKEGDKTELFIHLHLYAQEGKMMLYGFSTFKELEFFELLISISGVGPKVALGVLSLAPVEQIKEAVINEDTDILTKVSGVGKKTAGRIVLELKNKLDIDDISKISGKTSSQGLECIEALTKLGYSVSEAREALKQVPKDTEEVKDKVRLALKTLGGKK